MVVQPAIAPPVAQPSATPLARRLLFFDNLRVVAMALVIMHHVGQVYGPTLGQWPIPPDAQTAFILDPFFTVNRSFGMSLFFMIAGYFAVLSCDKKGPGLFIKDRLLRLGIPLIAWTVFMAVMQTFLTPTPATGYRRVPWPVDVAHLWFVQQLLILCILYALARLLLRDRRERERMWRVPPGWAIIVFAVGLAIASAAVRIWYDMDEWVYLLGFVKLQPFDFVRDSSLFFVGVLASRHNWVVRFPSRSGRAWFGVGLTLAAGWYAFRLIAPGGVSIDEKLLGALFTLWESFLCVSLSIGMTVLFRDLWSTQSGLMKKAAQGQYATYIIHVGVVLLFQWAAMGLAAAPLVKFALVSLVSVPAAFMVGYWIRKPLKL